MYEASSIVSALGDKALVYAKNKNRGGRSSAKGRDFELLYGAYHVALEGAAAHAGGQDGSGVTFEDQVLCFVDDFVLTNGNGRTLAQLKSGAASWAVGDHPLGDDFRMQSMLDSACGVSASYLLVVSSDQTKSALIDARPADLAGVAVERFPEGLSDVDLIAAMPDLADALQELSPRPPEKVVREQVFRMILGTWASSRGEQKLSDLINAAAEGPGAVVAPLLAAYELPPSAKIVLDKVPHLRFYVAKGFFGYECGNMRGIAEYHSRTPEFEAFLAELCTA